MAKTRRQSALHAAECARRTGLTVRALRVYERYGLIAPKRSAKGWRTYGPRELIRLNTIVALKGLGLTLTQIREAVTGKSPSLTRVLGMQLESARSRRSTTDKVIGLIELALAKLRDRERLSIDELCALLRSTETHTAPLPAQQSIEEMFTAQELRDWRAYDRRFRHYLPAARTYAAELRTLAAEYRRLMARGAPPGSPQAQALLTRHNALALRSGFRRKFLMRANWNLPLARKIYAYSNRLLEEAPQERSAAGTLTDYMFAVRDASRWWRALQKLAELAAGLRSRGALLDSAVAEELARSFMRVCRRHGLGDAAEYAAWQGEFGLQKHGERWIHFDAATRGAWHYLRDAVLAFTGEELTPLGRAGQRLSAVRSGAGMLTRYASPGGDFALEIPAHWRSSPAVLTNSPHEVIRFSSHEEGIHLLIVFRGPQLPGQSLEERSAHVQHLLAGKGFVNFSTAEAQIGPWAARTLDFERPQGGGVWSCREYFVTDGEHSYTLGFGTTDRNRMFALFERIAQSFEMLAQGDEQAA